MAQNNISKRYVRKGCLCSRYNMLVQPKTLDIPRHTYYYDFFYAFILLWMGVGVMNNCNTSFLTLFDFEHIKQLQISGFVADLKYVVT